MLGWPWGRDDREAIEIAVFGMACRHCVATVETALEDLEEVTVVDVDRGSHRARVHGPDGLPVDRLVEQVRSVGYEARPVSSPG